MLVTKIAKEVLALTVLGVVIGAGTELGTKAANAAIEKFPRKVPRVPRFRPFVSRRLVINTADFESTEDAEVTKPTRHVVSASPSRHNSQVSTEERAAE